MIIRTEGKFVIEIRFFDAFEAKKNPMNDGVTLSFEPPSGGRVVEDLIIEERRVGHHDFVVMVDTGAGNREEMSIKWGDTLRFRQPSEDGFLFIASVIGIRWIGDKVALKLQVSHYEGTHSPLADLIVVGVIYGDHLSHYGARIVYDDGTSFDLGSLLHANDLAATWPEEQEHYLLVATRKIGKTANKLAEYARWLNNAMVGVEAKGGEEVQIDYDGVFQMWKEGVDPNKAAMNLVNIDHTKQFVDESKEDNREPRYVPVLWDMYLHGAHDFIASFGGETFIVFELDYAMKKSMPELVDDFDGEPWVILCTNDDGDVAVISIEDIENNEQLIEKFYHVVS